MKKYLAILATMLALVSLGAAIVPYCPPPLPSCTDGVCDYNSITQTNWATGESGKAYVDSNWGGIDVGNLVLNQEQKNCAMVLGEGNTVTQSSAANAKGTDQKQVQDNVAMVVGYSNSVYQSNSAMAIGLVADGNFGIYQDQTQKNLMLIIGSDNHAGQSNDAQSYTDSKIWPAYPTEQTQTNVGLLLGKKNYLNQENDATATMQKEIEVDPKISQIQKNIAFAVNNCQDCQVDTTFAGTTQFTWPVVTAPAPAIPTIACPSGDCGVQLPA